MGNWITSQLVPLLEAEPSLFAEPIDASGNLTDTGEALVTDSPMNVYCAPGDMSGVTVNFFTNDVTSFSIPGLSTVDVRTLSGVNGLSGLIDPAGDRVYVRSEGGAVDIFDSNAATGALGAAPLLSFRIATSASTFSFFGMDQMALLPNGAKLYVSQPSALNVYDASTGELLTAITDPNIVQPTGVCFAPTAPPTDSDGDGVPDAEDNCPAIPNPDQLDSNFDGIGNACQETTALDTTGFLQANRDGSSTAEATDPASGEPPLEEQLTRIVQFQIEDQNLSLAEAEQLTQNLVNSQVDLGLVAPGEAQELVDSLLQRIDLDGDGVPNNADTCPNSHLSATVFIDGCVSGVTNTLFTTGCTISDRIRHVLMVCTIMASL